MAPKPPARIMNTFIKAFVSKAGNEKVFHEFAADGIRHELKRNRLI
jgi:hypothetical protein